jgi:hypothetical protein
VTGLPAQSATNNCYCDDYGMCPPCLEKAHEKRVEQLEAELAAERERSRVLEEALRVIEEHFCHLYNRATKGENFEAKEIMVHASGLLKRVRDALYTGRGSGENQDG